MIRTFKKTFLPDVIKYKDAELRLYVEANTHTQREAERSAEALKAQGLTVCLVEVMSSNLKGRNDLHGKPYTPNYYVMADISKPEEIKHWRERVEFWKKCFKPRTRKYLTEVRNRNNAGKLNFNNDPAAQNQAITEILNS